MKTRIFVASSRESTHIAHAIKKHLEDCADIRVWDESFQLSVPIIDGLLAHLGNGDFGVFILSAEDAVRLREKDYLSCRDNIIFELGLFMGRLGRERAVFLLPKNLPPENEFRIPTDLQGMVYATFDLKESAQLATQAACQQIRRQIEQLASLRLYHISNKENGKCLDVRDWKRRPGAEIVQWAYHGGANQLWRLERAEDRFHYVRSEHSDLYLTAPSQNGAPQVTQHELRGYTDGYQQWEFISLPGGAYRITPRYDDELCLAVTGDTTENGTPVVVSRWRHEGPYQWWLNIKATLK